MAKYWTIYSNKKDENGDLAPQLLSLLESGSGRDHEIIASKGASNEQMMLLAPADGDGRFVSIQQTVTGQDGNGDDIIQLDLIYDEDAHNDACWEMIRGERDRLLKDSDWAMFVDVPMSAGKKTEWEDYRQALRDVPQTPGIDPKDDSTYSWPSQPA